MSARDVPARRLRWLLGVLCVLESLADFAASKCRHGDNLEVLAFGAVSLRLLDLGVPYLNESQGDHCPTMHDLAVGARHVWRGCARNGDIMSPWASAAAQ